MDLSPAPVLPPPPTRSRRGECTNSLTGRPARFVDPSPSADDSEAADAGPAPPDRPIVGPTRRAAVGSLHLSSSDDEFEVMEPTRGRRTQQPMAAQPRPSERSSSPAGSQRRISESNSYTGQSEHGSAAPAVATPVTWHQRLAKLPGLAWRAAVIERLTSQRMNQSPEDTNGGGDGEADDCSESDVSEYSPSVEYDSDDESAHQREDDDQQEDNRPANIMENDDFLLGLEMVVAMSPESRDWDLIALVWHATFAAELAQVGRTSEGTARSLRAAYLDRIRNAATQERVTDATPAAVEHMRARVHAATLIVPSD